MDLLADPPPIDLNNRRWIVHTRTEERPPVRIASNAQHRRQHDRRWLRHLQRGDRRAQCTLAGNDRPPGGCDPRVGDHDRLSDRPGAVVEYSILDKQVKIGENAHIGGYVADEQLITTIGKHADIPAELVVEPGAIIGPDVFTGRFLIQDRPQRRLYPNQEGTQ